MASEKTKSHPFDEQSYINALTLKKDDKDAYTDEPSKPFANTNFSKSKMDFHWVYSDEPHRTRRSEILKAHPEIRDLFGPEPLTGYMTVALTLSQIWIASWIATQSWWVILTVMYVYGCTVNHALQLANHEISHNLASESLTVNLILGVIANFATGLPSSVTFRYYHMDHHQYQGADVIDTDVPCAWEVRTFTSTPLKFVWMCCQSLAYGFRPMYVNPKPLTREQVMNAVIVFAFDGLIAYWLGFGALAYLVCSTLVGIGLHPCAGHFIAEHYEFVKGYETYSYYGICNYFNFNVGYHNEHHDFPKIPWSRLPMVRRVAPEWYEHLPHHESYCAVIYQYITDDEIGPWSRIKRLSRRQKKAAETSKKED
jgi:sphingolipid delta-4 desaturase